MRNEAKVSSALDHSAIALVGNESGERHCDSSHSTWSVGVPRSPSDLEMRVGSFERARRVDHGVDNNFCPRRHLDLLKITKNMDDNTQWLACARALVACASRVAEHADTVSSFCGAVGMRADYRFGCRRFESSWKSKFLPTFGRWPKVFLHSLHMLTTSHFACFQSIFLEIRYIALAWKFQAWTLLESSRRMRLST